MKIEELEKGGGAEKELLRLVIAAFDEFKKHISWESVFTTRTVDELLFGYKDELLQLIHDIKSSLVPNPVFAFSVSVYCYYTEFHMES